MHNSHIYGRDYFCTAAYRSQKKKKSNGKVDMVVALINATYLLQQDVFLNNMDFIVQVIT